LAVSFGATVVSRGGPLAWAFAASQAETSPVVCPLALLAVLQAVDPMPSAMTRLHLTKRSAMTEAYGL
jgi:hypothetical protein